MKKEYLYNVGDRVRIKNTSSYYVDNDKDNPKNINGIITEYNVCYYLPVCVKWENGGYNCYNESDLELIDSKIVSNVTIVEEVKQEVKSRRRLLI
jgi:hypothetical protein